MKLYRRNLGTKQNNFEGRQLQKYGLCVFAAGLMYKLERQSKATHFKTYAFHILFFITVCLWKPVILRVRTSRTDLCAEVQPAVRQIAFDSLTWARNKCIVADGLAIVALGTSILTVGFDIVRGCRLIGGYFLSKSYSSSELFECNEGLRCEFGVNKYLKHSPTSSLE